MSSLISSAFQQALLLVLAAASPTRWLEGADYLVLAGAAGCDVADSSCARDSPGARRVLWSYLLRQTGALTPSGHLTLDGTPAWLEWAPQLQHCVYAALVDTSKLAAFELVANRLILRGEVPSGGVNPVYAAVSADAATLLVANYHGPDDVNNSRGASVASFHVAENCALTLAAVVNHSGKSVVPGRQDSAHVHSFVPARNHGLAYACDLGQDLIVAYKVSPAGALEELHRTRTGLGDGPRHLIQHPAEPVVYVVNELASTVRVYDVGDAGTLHPGESFSTLPTGADHTLSKAAELAISEDGLIVYATTRGEYNAVVVFKSFNQGRSLELIQRQQVTAFPRGMKIVPGGRLMLVEGQHEGILQAYSIEGKRGTLEWIGTNVTGPPTAAALSVVSVRTTTKESLFT